IEKTRPRYPEERAHSDGHHHHHHHHHHRRPHEAEPPKAQGAHAHAIRTGDSKDVEVVTTGEGY
ncbi:hypothetical protein JCM10212_005736, partial [Sporobolomyces blumeae]